MSFPWTLIVPPVGAITFVKLLKVVLLPAPFTPKSAKHSPESTAKEAFSTARIGSPNGTL